MIYYVAKNTILKYWKIEILGYLNPENNRSCVFKGKTVEGAIKAAHNHCKNLNQKCKYQQLYVGNVLYECDFWGRKRT